MEMKKNFIQLEFGVLTNENMEEDWLKINSYDLEKKEGYSQTKAINEILLKNSFKKFGLKIFIYRITSISSDSNNGFSNENDFINLFLSFCLENKIILKNSSKKLHLIPVDFCSKSIVKISKNINSINNQNVFNLFGEEIDFDFIIKELENFGYELNCLNKNDWKKKIDSKIDEKKKIFSLKSSIINFFEIQNEVYPSKEKTKNCLKNFNLNFPIIEKKNLNLFFEYMKKNKLFP
jgi:thioester reductase-like protein